MVSKAQFMRALEELPDNATIEDAMDRLYVLYKIQKGLEDIAAGRVISDEELTERIKQWRE